ncbi:MAG: hypothetical protein IKS33_08660 [Bacteroidales bacterium]|nr:hypothetical protein [Bacteroidales bacterium]
MKKMKFSCIILSVLLFSCFCACAQKTSQAFHGPYTILTLYDSGIYHVNFLFSNLAIIPYKSQSQHYISFGNYTKKGKYYILTADKSIRYNQGECKSFSVLYNKTPVNDSIVVIINSPYEDESKKCSLAKIFSYNLILYLSNGEVINLSDTCNRISSYLNDSLCVSKLELYITHLPDFYNRSNSYSFTYCPYCYIPIDSIPSDSNMIIINLPTFEYFSLTYAPYNNYKIRIINKHKLVFDGEILRRYDAIDEMRFRRLERRRMRPHYINKILSLQNENEL